jgi:hypothetical protein
MDRIYFLRPETKLVVADFCEHTFHQIEKGGDTSEITSRSATLDGLAFANKNRMEPNHIQRASNQKEPLGNCHLTTRWCKSISMPRQCHKKILANGEAVFCVSSVKICG